LAQKYKVGSTRNTCFPSSPDNATSEYGNDTLRNSA